MCPGYFAVETGTTYTFCEKAWKADKTSMTVKRPYKL